MKGMGQLTEREGAKLESSASTLNNLKQSESSYAEELKKLQRNLASAYQNIGGDVTEQNQKVQSQPQTMILNGKTLFLQSDGTYK